MPFRRQTTSTPGGPKTPFLQSRYHIRLLIRACNHPHLKCQHCLLEGYGVDIVLIFVGHGPPVSSANQLKSRWFLQKARSQPTTEPTTKVRIGTHSGVQTWTNRTPYAKEPASIRPAFIWFRANFGERASSSRTRCLQTLNSEPRRFKLIRMAEPASIFDPEDGTAKERAIAAAEALPEADDVSLDDVRRWLQSWGKPDELPPPPWK